MSALTPGLANHNRSDVEHNTGGSGLQYGAAPEHKVCARIHGA